MTPEEYLKSEGIELKSTVLISFIDGIARNPDICQLLKGYASLKGCDHAWQFAYGSEPAGINYYRCFTCQASLSLPSRA